MTLYQTKGSCSLHPEISELYITSNGIDNLLNKINSHKATGPDNISDRLLKEMQTQIEPILCQIFKKSYNIGITPNDWKHARVAPAYKKGDKLKPVNYRPISLTCICCKLIMLMEHIVTSHIMKHLETNNILYDLQHGFRHS